MEDLPPPSRLKYLNICTIALKLLVAAATALLLAACPPPGGGGSTTYTTTVSGTVTGSAPGETSIDLPGSTVSAVTTPADPANRPVTSGPDGAFTLQVKHSGSFKLKVGNTCSEPFTGAAVTASADGIHNAGALQLTLKPEPAGTARYSITPRTAGGFKLTVNNCVREIGNSEFSSLGTIITDKANAESVNRFTLLTEIDLPPTLRKIDNEGLFGHSSISGTLRIPRNVETLITRALSSVGSNSSTNPDGYTLFFEAGSKLKSIGDSVFRTSRLKDFRFPENLETIDLGAFQNVRFFFSAGFSSAGTLTIPAKVSKIGDLAFSRTSNGVSGITTVDIRSKRLAKPAGAVAADFPLQPNLFQNVTGITSITLLAEVYDSYTSTERSAIFGAIPLTRVP